MNFGDMPKGTWFTDGRRVMCKLQPVLPSGIPVEYRSLAAADCPEHGVKRGDVLQAKPFNAIDSDGVPCCCPEWRDFDVVSLTVPGQTMNRARITFAGVSFSAPLRGEQKYTVPTPAFRKILASGRVACRCNYRYTDDYAGDAEDNCGRGAVPAADVAAKLDLGRPWLLYLQGGEIRFSPYQSLSYSVTELPCASK